MRSRRLPSLSPLVAKGRARWKVRASHRTESSRQHECARTGRDESGEDYAADCADDENGDQDQRARFRVNAKMNVHPEEGRDRRQRKEHGHQEIQPVGGDRHLMAVLGMLLSLPRNRELEPVPGFLVRQFRGPLHLVRAVSQVGQFGILLAESRRPPATSRGDAAWHEPAEKTREWSQTPLPGVRAASVCRSKPSTAAA